MPVLERCRECLGEPEFREIFDADTIALAHEAFGDCPQLSHRFENARAAPHTARSAALEAAA